MAAFDAMAGMDPYKFLRRFDFAFRVLAGNAAELESLRANLTSRGVAPTVFRYGAHASSEEAFLNVSRVLHNFLSATYALSEIIDGHLKRRERRSPRWTAVRSPIHRFLTRTEIELALAVRDHAIHVDTLDAGFTRTLTDDSDEWTLHISKDQLAPRRLSPSARAHFEEWPSDVTIEVLVDPVLRAATELRRDLIAAVSKEFRAELDNLIAEERRLTESFPRFFDARQ